MKTFRSLVVLSVLSSATALAESGSSQPAEPVASPDTAADTAAPLAAAVTIPIASGETSLHLEIGFGIRHVPAARATVPVGELLRVTAPDFGPVQWRKNGHDIPGATQLTLLFPSVKTEDAGSYEAIYTDPAMNGRGTQKLVLGVGPTDRLVNVSTRGFVGSGGDQGMVTGFVVAAGERPKRLIVRAIGPSLSLFGVPNPLARPVLRIYDSQGRLYEQSYAYLPYVGGLTYEQDLALSLARTGAFPLPENAPDPVLMKPFIAGTYTAQVTSGDGSSGAVLLEVYEVP